MPYIKKTQHGLSAEPSFFDRIPWTPPVIEIVLYLAWFVSWIRFDVVLAKFFAGGIVKGFELPGYAFSRDVMICRQSSEGFAKTITSSQFLLVIVELQTSRFSDCKSVKRSHNLLHRCSADSPSINFPQLSTPCNDLSIA